MQYIIKNTIKITFLNSHKRVFHRSDVKKNTFSKNTSTRNSVKWALKY